MQRVDRQNEPNRNKTARAYKRRERERRKWLSRPTLVHVIAASLPQRIALHPGRAAGWLHEWQRAPLSQHATATAASPSTEAGGRRRRPGPVGAVEVGGGRAHGARHGAAAHLGWAVGGCFFGADLRLLLMLELLLWLLLLLLLPLGVLGLFRVCVARLIVAEMTNVSLDAPRTWPLLFIVSARLPDQRLCPVASPSMRQDRR